MARSNGVFLPLLRTPPLPGQGWQVRVISCDDWVAYAGGLNPTPLAVLNRFVELTVSPEIGDVCAGSVTLSEADPIWDLPLSDGSPASTLRDRQHLFVVTEDGAVRGEFIGQRESRTLVDTGEEATRVVVLSGPGPAQTLDWAKVFTPYYPKTPPKGKIGVYQFRDKPVMAAWLSLLAAAQRRGTVPYIKAGFDAARDSARQAWEDTYTVPPSNTGTAKLAGDVLFPTDQFTLTTAGAAAVAAVSAKIAAITYPAVTVVGHADSRGTTAYNYQLALDRANTVANAILAVHPFAVMTVISKGETQPVASNATAAGQAKNRFVRVTYQKASTSGAHSIYEPDRGVSLLALLKDLTGGQVVTERSPIHVEWMMGPRFVLTVRRRIGKDRSGAVVFHEGSTAVVSEAVDFNRDRLANLIAVQTELGEYTVAADTASRRRWLQREYYQRLSGVYTAAIRSAIANTQRAMQANQDASWTVAIGAGARGRRPFKDFGLGDTIGLSRYHGGTAASTVDKQRVMAISAHVNADNQVSFELRLETTRMTRLRWLQANLDALITRRRGITAYISDDEPTGASPGDLWTPP